MNSGILGSINIFIGAYFFLVATGVIKARNQENMAYRKKWGPVWSTLSLLMIIGGLIQIFVL